MGCMTTGTSLMDEIKSKRSIFEALGVDVDLIFADAERTVVPAGLQEVLHHRRSRRIHKKPAVVRTQDFRVSQAETTGSAQMKQTESIVRPAE
jgi:hypothetical protein